MEYESDVEDERSEFNTSEIDWGEEQDLSGSEEEEKDYNSWRGDADSEFSTGEAYERNEEHWDDEIESESAFYEEEDLGDTSSQIGLEESALDKENSESSFCGGVGLHDSLDDQHHEFDSQINSGDDQWRQQHVYEEESSYDEEEASHDEGDFQINPVEEVLTKSELDEEENYGDIDSEREEDNTPWCEIPYSDHEEEHQEETDSPGSREEFAEGNEVESEAGRDNLCEAYTKEDEDLVEEPRYINFSGHSQGPYAYTQWEDDMEAWFASNNVPEEEKTTIAEETLTEDAFRCWEQDAYIRLDLEVPDATWEEMKDIMRDEYIRDIYNMRQHYVKIDSNPKPRRWILAPRSSPKATPKKAYSPKPRQTSPPALKEKTESNPTTQAKEEKQKLIPQAVAHKQNPSSKLEQHGELKHCKSSNLLKSKEVICYRCHKRGHFAVTCPEKNMINNASIEPKLSPLETSNKINELSFENSSSRIMLLSMPKVVHTGLIMEQEVKEVVRSLGLEEQYPRKISQIQVNDDYEFVKYFKNIMLTRSLKYTTVSTYITNKMHLIFPLSVKERTGTLRMHNSRKEEPPDPTPLLCTVLHKKLKKDHTQVSNTQLSFIYNDSKSVIMNMLSLEELDKNVGATRKHLVQNNCSITQVEPEQKSILNQKCLPVYNNSMTVLMHLILPKGVRYIAGLKGEPPDRNIQGQYRGKFKATILHTLGTTEALEQYLFKEKPPDFKKMPNDPSDTKSSWTRGMTLNSQRRMKANLLSLSADYTVLRSKLLQEGGYDEVIKPSTNHGRDHMEQRQADETEESKSTQQGPNQSQVKKEIEPRTNIGVPQVMMRGIKTSSRTVLFFLHCGFIPMGFPGKVLTRQQLVGAQEPKANFSSSTTTWITFSSHLVSTSKWNQPIIRSDEGCIDFTSQLNSNIPDLDRCTLKGGFRPDQEEPSNEETCYGILTHQRSSGNWISTKPISDEEVIQFLNWNTLNLPYMESCGFGSLQSHIWRPGDILNQPETLKYSSTSAKTQSIIWIISRIKLLYARPELPYSEPCEFNSQGIFPQLSRHEFKADSMHLDVPRHHSFAPKLSRIKKSHNLPHLDDSLFIAPTALFI